MAFGTEYYTDFLDPQGNTHSVLLQKDGGTANTRLTPAGDPFVWAYGAQRDNEYLALKPTSAELRVIVDDAAVFSAIAGSNEKEWLLIWKIGSAEMWRGWVLSDEMIQPVDVPGTLTIRAVCGLVLAEKQRWSPATTGVRTLMSIAAEALAQIGHDLEIASAVNWHAYSGGSAVTSGNSLEQYSVDTRAFSDTYGRRARTDPTSPEYATVAEVLAQIAGRFGAQVFQADGRWHIVQRELITGASVSERIYTSAGVYDSASAGYPDEEIGTATLEILADSVLSTNTAYTSVRSTFAHGALGNSFIANGNFGTWTTGPPALPLYWNEIDENPAVAPNTGSIVTRRTTKLEALVTGNEDEPSTQCVEIAYVQAGSAAVDPRAYCLIGIKQDSYLSASAGDQIEIDFVAALSVTGPNESGDYGHRWSSVALWLDGDAGTDYYWSGIGTLGAWVSAGVGGIPTHTTTAAAASKMLVPLDPAGIPTVAKLGRTTPLPDSGKIRVVLYNPVEATAVATVHYTGVLYDAVRVSVFDGTGEEITARTQTVYTATDATVEERGTFDAGTYFLGDVGGLPGNKGVRGIKYSGTYTQNWNVGGGAAPSPDVPIDTLLSRQVLKAKLVPRKVVRAAVCATGGSPPELWPSTPVDFDSAEYSLVYLKRSAAYDEYELEGVATGVSSPTITDAEVPISFVALEPSWDDLSDGTFGGPPKDPGTTIGGGGGRGGIPIPRANGAVAAGGSQAGDIIQVGIGAAATELVNLRSASGSSYGDVAIRFDSGFGGTGVFVMGIDTSDSNKFKITEGLALGTTPTSGTGDRFVIDADGNVTFNPDFGGTTYYVSLDGKPATVGDTYNDSGNLRWISHYYTGGADNEATAEAYLSGIDGSGGTEWRLDKGSYRFGVSGSGHLFLSQIASGTYDSNAIEWRAAYSDAGRYARAFYDQVSGDTWSLKLIAYSDAGSTAGTTFEVLSAGGVKWGGMTFPNADGSANQVLTTNGSGTITWATPAGAGNVSNSGTPADGQIAVWTSSTAIEGDSALTFDTTTDSLVVAASGKFKFGAVAILDDNAGTTTLSNIDALDATTETTIENAIDTLPNLILDGVGDVALTAVAQGDILYRNGASEWANLPAGTSGRVLKTQGAGANPLWGTLASSDLSDAANVAHVNATETITNKWTFGLTNLLLQNVTTGLTTLNAGDAAGNITITLPATAGTLYVTGGTDVAVADGGTGKSSWTTNGIVYASGTTTLAQVSVNATATAKFLKQVSSGAPSFETIAAADLSDGANIAHINANETITGAWSFGGGANLTVVGTSYFRFSNVTSGYTTFTAADSGTIAVTLPSASGTLLTSADSVNAFADVTITSAAEGNTLVHDGSVWINAAPAWHNVYSMYTQDSTASDSQTSIIDQTAVGSRTIAAGTLKAGTIVHFRAWGTVTTDTENLTLRFFFNTTGSGTEAFSLSGPTTDSLNAVAWTLDVWCVVKTTGGSGTMQVSGRYWVNGAEAAITPAHITSQQEAIDTTAANIVNLTAQWSAAGTSTIYCDHASIDMTRQAF